MGSKRQLFAALLIGTVAAAPAMADVKAGVDAWERGDYPRAVAEWRPAATAGDPDAQFNLAQAYKLGRGVAMDLNAAESWYRKAAAQGHAQSEDNLGLVLFQSGKREEAMPWIRKSAERGEPRAQYVLGTALFNGDLAEKDWVRAYALMSRSSAQGISQATTSLAQMDRYIPSDQRQRGAALARDLEARQHRPAPPAAQAAADPAGHRPIPMAAPIRPVQPKVAQTDIPPSRPGADYPPPTRTPAAPPPSPPRASAPTPAPPPPIPAARSPAPTASGGWRVQLGAFSNAQRATTLWQRVSRLDGFQALQSFMVPAGAVTRLQAGPVDGKAAADRLCATATAAGHACFPVRP